MSSNQLKSKFGMFSDTSKGQIDILGSKNYSPIPMKQNHHRPVQSLRYGPVGIDSNNTPPPDSDLVNTEHTAPRRKQQPLTESTYKQGLPVLSEVKNIQNSFAIDKLGQNVTNKNGGHKRGTGASYL